MHKVFLISILILFFSLTSLSGQDSDRESKTSVNIKVPQKISFIEKVDFSGVTEPYNEKIIKATVTTKIGKIFVVNGEWVQKGQEILTFDKIFIKSNILKTEKEIGGWEKILSERKKWKDRDKKSENEAERKIKIARNYLKRLKVIAKNPVLISPISGRVSSLLTPGDRIREGSVVVKIVDDYLIKVKLKNGEESSSFKNGEFVDLRLKNSPGKIFQGRVKSDNSGKYILINNSKLSLSAGIPVLFKSEKKFTDVIILKKEDFITDNGANYIYIVDSDRAIKKSVSLKKLNENKFLLASKIEKGVAIVSPIPGFTQNMVNIEINTKNQLPLKAGLLKKRNKKNAKRIYKSKKLEYVISSGLSISKPKEIHYRSSGLNTLISQYSQFYGLQNNHSGVFKENYLGIPLILNVNYSIKNDLLVKAGVEYSSMGNSSSKLYSLDWTNTTEKFEYSINNRITSIMPFVGLEKRFSSFALYLSAGLNLVNIKHSNNLNYNEGIYSLDNRDEYKLKGSGFGLIFGGKYMIKVGKKSGIFLKIEYVLGSIGKFAGTKTSSSSDSTGNSFSDISTGSVYVFDYNPFDISWFKWWDIYNSSPDSSDIRNVSRFSLNFSRLRFIAGFSF